MVTFDDSATPSLSPDNLEPLQIRQEQIRLLYKPLLNAAVATTIASCFLAYIQWNSIEHTTILLWLTFMGLVIAIRALCFFIFKLKAPDCQCIPFWEKLHTFISTCAGFVWGYAGIFLFPEGDFERQAATIVVIAGMAAGAVSTLSALRAPVFIFLPLTMLPLTIHLFLESTETATLLAIMCAVYTVFLIYAANHTYMTHLQNITLRIRSRDREKAIRKSEQTLLKTSEILKMIAKGDPANGIYNAIARLYESRHPGLRCSMLELKGNKLMHGGAPSLPKEYCDAVNGLENGPSVGSCGTSTYTGERVLVENIETDPKWAELKDAALPHGMRCCWSEPIKDITGKVLGAFGMYYDYPALPNDHESADLEDAARLAGIVMVREHRETLLRKLSQAIEQAGEAVTITDTEGTIEYINPSFTKMTGYTAKEVLGKNPRMLKSGNQTQEYYAELWATITSGKVWHSTIVDRRKDGSQYPAIMSISPIFDKEEITHFVGIQQDMTDHELLEDKLRQAQKMEALGTLVGGIAHDFNNILAGITGNLYLAKKKVLDNPDVLQKLTSIEQLSDRAADLIKQLLTFARKDRVSMEKLKLFPLVEETFKFLRTSVPESIDMHLDVDSDSIQINGDSTQIYQVLMNLVNNAHDALEGVNEPLIIIRIEAFYADDMFVKKHKYFQAGHYAHLSVEDNGYGIPEHQIEHLFEPFYTTKEVGKGTGLGLSMVFGAIERHHGFIEVESIEGEGSTFHVYIPLLETGDFASVSLQENGKGIAERGKNELILLVDDEELILEMGEEVLKTLGYRVLKASNGLEAIDIFIANQNEISLIITDIVMPRLGGVQAVERIRELRPDVKIIFSTGYDKNLSFPKKILSGDDLVLSKPYDISVLSKTIKDKLGS